MGKRLLEALICAGVALGLALPASAAEYRQNPTKHDFIDVLGKEPVRNAPDNPGGLRAKGDTRGLKLGVAAPQTAQKKLPSLNFPVHFDFGSSRLTPQAMSTLDQLGEALKSSELQPYRFRIVGHTDAVGSEAFNLDLSRERAEAVERYLSERHGIERGRINTVGMGKDQLLDPRNPYSGVNRRVEIVNEGRQGS